MAANDGNDAWLIPKKKRDNRNYIRQNNARDLEKTLKITGFAEAMISAKSRHLQDQGYVFERVLKGDETRSLGEGEVAVPIENKYGDALIFVKIDQ